MKTLTSSILSMAIFVMLAFLNLLCIAANIRAEAWGLLALSSVAFLVAVGMIILTYKSARKYEDLIREAISKLMMESAIRDFKEFCEAVKEDAPETETKKEEKDGE